MRKNILFTGVGRRIELIQAFKQAALFLNIDLKIYGVDMMGTAPALAFCDYRRKVCGMKDKEYIPELLNICKTDKIDLIIPTIDTDLLVLSKNVEKFDKVGTKVLISKTDKIEICRDKNYTSSFFEECGLNAPKTYNNYEEYDKDFPCFIKPKDGSSSINAFKVNSKEELEYLASKVEEYIIQPFIDGTEYTIDIFCDFKGNPVYITPRIRTAVRSGEVLKTQICIDEKIIEESKKLINKFKPCGPLTVQLIREKNTNIDYFIEINPRYGGGAPLSMKAGARSAKTILEIISNKNVEKSDYILDGAIYSRFDQSVCINQNKINKINKIKGVIFDLDDTLYSEKEYIKSGFNEVAKYLENNEYSQKLYNYFEQGENAIDKLLAEINKLEIKEECLNIYRNHLPKINLYDDVINTINKLKSLNIKVGIITDGRANGQKNKIKSLGLDKIVEDIIITDELGGIQFRKPNDISFRIMQCRWKIPYEEIAYIGDNINKDYQAPIQLGMHYILFDNVNGIYNFNEEIKDFHKINKISQILNC